MIKRDAISIGIAIILTTATLELAEADKQTASPALQVTSESTHGSSHGETDRPACAAAEKPSLPGAQGGTSSI